MMKFGKIFGVFFIFGLLIFSLGGCQSDSPSENQTGNNLTPKAESNATANSHLPENTDQEKKTETHEHSAPHGGTLIVFGEEFAHLESVLNAGDGEIIAYALDGEAEKSVPLAQETIEIEIEKPQKINLILEAVENILTGEKRGATSEFRAKFEQKDLKEFDAKVKSVTIRGREFKNVHFNFPKGNESQHRH